jgi:glycosyltransferase involved in cell wall biosynthesis
MHITHIYRTYYPDPPGGLQEAIRQICLATSKLGVENDVFCLSPRPDPSEIIRPECRVIRYRSWYSLASCDIGGISAYFRFAQLAENSDILHYQYPWPFADFMHLLAKTKKPSILTYHSDIVRQELLGKLYAPLMWKMLLSMRFIVATSPAYAKTSPILSHQLIRDRVRVIPLGIDEQSYPLEGDNSIYSRLGLNDEPYFLFLGVLRYYKGLHTLVQSANKVGAKIVIAGSGPILDELQSTVDKLGITNVIFAGQVSDAEKVSLLKKCHALILPSHLRSEAFGMVLVEAAMFGRPMISCEIGTGTSFVNAHNVTGFVVPPESPAALADAMCSLLRDHVMTEKFGLAARERYENLFSGAALGRAYYELYKEALAATE